MKEMLKLILRKFGYEVYRYHPYPTHLENRGEFDYVETETGKYYLPPDATNDAIAKEIRWNKVFDQHILDIAVEYIKEDSIVLDVGSNFGQMAIQFAKHVGQKGMVYAFEANHYVFRVLEKNIEVNKAHVKAFEGAVHTVSGETLYFPEPDIATYGTYGSFGIDYVHGLGTPVKSLALDDLDYPLPVSFMKVDIQGGDLMALKGARNTINKFRMPIVFEYEFRLEKTLGLRFQDYVDFVDSINYVFYRAPDNNYVVLPRESCTGK